MMKYIHFRKNKFSQSKQRSFFKNLARLTGARIPITESLNLIYETTKNKKDKLIIEQIWENIQRGVSLSKSVFLANLASSNIIHLISVGEKTGNLSSILDQISKYIEAKTLLRRKIIGAFVYPCIIAFATIGFTVALTLFIFPKIIPIFSSLHVKLPLTTRFVIACVYFFTHYFLYALFLTVIFILVLIFYIKKHRIFKLKIILTILRIPLIGKVLKFSNCAEFFRTLGILLKSGSFLPEAVFISGQTLLLPYTISGDMLKEKVERGEMLSSALQTHEFLFPAPTINIVAIGEKSGELALACADIAALFDETIDSYTKSFTQIIEPVLMVFMGLIVGFVALSIITPIYAITQNIH